MSKTTMHKGRLCNQIFRNIALSLIAEKINLKVDYANYNLINNCLGIKLFIGDIEYEKEYLLTDDNYKDILDNSNKFHYNLNPNNNYFQSNNISNIIYDFLREKNQKAHIIYMNPFKERYNNNTDLFIHIRLSDATKFNVGIDYYINIIKQITSNNIFIGTDSVNHSFIHRIKTLYPNASLINESPERTIQFGSTCKNVILSHGSFSAIIGYLSFFSSNIYYPDCEPGWCPLEMFTNKNWFPIKV
jgi:hypothetical protein